MTRIECPLSGKNCWVKACHEGEGGAKCETVVPHLRAIQEHAAAIDEEMGYDYAPAQQGVRGAIGSIASNLGQFDLPNEITKKSNKS
jgi:hypothetical protein